MRRLLAGLLSLVAVLAGAGCGLSDAFVTREERAIVRQQLDQLRRGELEAAYHLMPGAYRAMNTVDDFATFVQAHPALRDNRSIGFPESGWSIDVGGVTFRHAVLTSNAGVTELFNYYVTHDTEGKWSVGFSPSSADGS